jgi:hypothetical protein
VATKLYKLTRRPTTWGGYQLLYDAPGKSGGNDEGHGETISRRTAGETPPCLQCRLNWHCGTTPHHVATWAQDHDDSHAKTCTTRWCYLQAKLARFPPSGSQPLSRENLYKGSQGTLPDISSSSSPFLDSRSSHSGSPSSSSSSPTSFTILAHHCKNFRVFKRGTCTRSSLRLDVGLRPEPV